MTTLLSEKFTEEKWQHFLRQLKDTHKKIHYTLKKEHLRELYNECGLSFTLLNQVSDRKMAILLNANPEQFKKLLRSKKMNLNDLFSIPDEQVITDILYHIDATLHFLQKKESTLTQLTQLSSSERARYFSEYDEQLSAACRLL